MKSNSSSNCSGRVRDLFSICEAHRSIYESNGDTAEIEAWDTKEKSEVGIGDRVLVLSNIFSPGARPFEDGDLIYLPAIVLDIKSPLRGDDPTWGKRIAYRLEGTDIVKCEPSVFSFYPYHIERDDSFANAIEFIKNGGLCAKVGDGEKMEMLGKDEALELINDYRWTFDERARKNRVEWGRKNGKWMLLFINDNFNGRGPIEEFEKQFTVKKNKGGIHTWERRIDNDEYPDMFMGNSENR